MVNIGRRIILTIFAFAAVTLSFSYAKTGKINANGISLAFVEEGSGQPLILIHGSVSDYREWSEQIPAFARNYRVIAISRRYHWPNAVPDSNADASVERQTDDLAAIMSGLKISSANIIGHSFGGLIALNFALHYPKFVRCLVLAEPAASGVLGNSPDDSSVANEAQAIRAEMKEAFASGDSERIVRTYADHVAPGQFEKASPQLRQMLLANVPAFQLDFTSRRSPFTCDDARRISIPVLVISGDHSPKGLQRIAQAVAGCINNAKFVKIPEATHWMQQDHVKVFNEAVSAFLAQQQ